MLTKYNLAKWSAVIAFLIFGLTIKAAFAQQIPFQELSSIGCQFLTGEVRVELYKYTKIRCSDFLEIISPAAPSAAHEIVSEKPKNMVLVRVVGFEPTTCRI